MPRTPEDRARAQQRVIKHGDYRGIIWGDMMQVHKKGSPERPVYRYDDMSGGEPDNMKHYPEDSLRDMVHAVGEEHEAGNLPEFVNTPGRNRQTEEQKKDEDFGSKFNISLED